MIESNGLTGRDARTVRRGPAGAASAFSINLPRTPSDYLDIVRFRWPWILAGLVVGAIGSQVALRSVPRQYASRTVVLVESEKIPKSFIPQLATEATQDRLRTVHEEILARPRVE